MTSKPPGKPRLRSFPIQLLSEYMYTNVNTTVFDMEAHRTLLRLINVSKSFARAFGDSDLPPDQLFQLVLLDEDVQLSGILVRYRWRLRDEILPNSPSVAFRLILCCSGRRIDIAVFVLMKQLNTPIWRKIVEMLNVVREHQLPVHMALVAIRSLPVVHFVADFLGHLVVCLDGPQEFLPFFRNGPVKERISLGYYSTRSEIMVAAIMAIPTVHYFGLKLECFSKMGPFAPNHHVEALDLDVTLNGGEDELEGLRTLRTLRPDYRLRIRFKDDQHRRRYRLNSLADLQKNAVEVKNELRRLIEGSESATHCGPMNIVYKGDFAVSFELCHLYYFRRAADYSGMTLEPTVAFYDDFRLSGRERIGDVDLRIEQCYFARPD